MRKAIFWSFSTLLTISQVALAVSPPNPTDSDAAGNTAGGTGALVNVTPYSPYVYSGTMNTGFGFHALFGNTAGSENTASGYEALYSNTTGNYNTAGGAYALRANTTGHRNTAHGSNALRKNTTGNDNTAVGRDALFQNTTGLANSVLGTFALNGNTTGWYNTAAGFRALQANTTGGNNTALGSYALLANTTGINNAALGLQSLQKNTTGFDNAAAGVSALQANTTGYRNTAYGRNALQANTTGLNNIAIGYNAGALLTTGNNNIMLGHTGNAGETATLRLGQVQTKTFIAGVRGTTRLTNLLPVYINNLGQLGVVTSSERYKEDIKDMGQASQRLLDLRPVTYHYKHTDAATDDKPLEYGLIAEEVAKVYPDLVTHGPDGQIDAVQYHKLVPMLLNEVQRLAGENRTMEIKSEEMAKQLADERNRNQEQTRTIQFQGNELQLMKQKVADMESQSQRLQALEARLLNMERNASSQQVALTR